MRALLLLGSFACTTAVVFGQAPVGDYGDAPDGGREAYPGVVGRFPTLFAPGAHHLDVSLGWLGGGGPPSVETDAIDPADPDGAPNLGPGTSNADARDDGLIRGYSEPPTGAVINMALQPATDRLTGVVLVTCGAGTAPRKLYLNALADVNRDGMWRGGGGVNEWTLRNFEIEQAPSSTAEYVVPLGTHLTRNDVWVRLTLTSQPIDGTPFLGQGGWDGSGSFAAGETEDYLLGADCFGPPTTPDQARCAMDAKCLGPVFLPHGVAGSVGFGIYSFDPANECDIDGEWELGPAAAVVLGMWLPPGNPANVGGTSGFTPELPLIGIPGVAYSKYFVGVDSPEDPPERGEGYLVHATLTLRGPLGLKVSQLDAYCPCEILHDEDGYVHDPVPIPPAPGPHPVGSLERHFFSSVRPEFGGGLFTISMRDRMFPGIPAAMKGIVPRYWVLNYEPGMPYSRDIIPNIFFQWDDLFPGGAPNGIANPGKLIAARLVNDPYGSGFDTTAPGGQSSALGFGGTDVNQPLTVNGVWVVGEDLDMDGVLDFTQRQRGDVNGDRVVDVGDLGSFFDIFLEPELPPIRRLNADVNEDGNVAADDQPALERLIIGKDGG